MGQPIDLAQMPTKWKAVPSRRGEEGNSRRAVSIAPLTQRDKPIHLWGLRIGM